MATISAGTTTSTTLTGIIWQNSGAGILPADLATIVQGIKNDQVNGLPIWPGAFGNNGLLSIPNRGVLKVLPGDLVAWDPATGWPVLVSKTALAGPDWNP